MFLHNILEHIHLPWEIVAEQAVEATQVRFSGEVQPHDLAQVSVDNVINSVSVQPKRFMSYPIKQTGSCESLFCSVLFKDDTTSGLAMTHMMSSLKVKSN